MRPKEKSAMGLLRKLLLSWLKKTRGDGTRTSPPLLPSSDTEWCCTCVCKAPAFHSASLAAPARQRGLSANGFGQVPLESVSLVLLRSHANNGTDPEDQKDELLWWMGSELCSDPWSVELMSILSRPHGSKVGEGYLPIRKSGCCTQWRRNGCWSGKMTTDVPSTLLTPACPSSVSWANTFPVKSPWPCPCHQF